MPATVPSRRRLLWMLALGAILIAVTAFGTAYLAKRTSPAAALEPSSALTVFFANHGEPPTAPGVFCDSSRPGDPVRSFYWKDTDTLTRGIVTVLEEAAARGLDGTKRVDGRRGAVDLVFATNHSLRVVLPGPEGELVGSILVDRSRPAPERAAVLEALERVSREKAKSFLGVRIYTIFMLNCGSAEDTSDHRRISEAIRGITGQRPAHILTTSDKVVPAYWYVAAGHASGKPMTIFDSTPGDSGAQNRPFLHIAAGGWFDFGSGQGVGLERPPAIPDKGAE